MSRNALFSAWGIPVSFDPFFIFGAFLIYGWSGGGRTGLFTVVALLVFVVVHEFGHALTAQAFGARAEITVTFLGGFASYVPSRPLRTREQITISAMGSLTQLAVAMVPLWWATRQIRTADSAQDLALSVDVYQAVIWAGVLIALLNLVPIWPLDGGHIAERLLEPLLGDRTPRVVVAFSLGTSVLMLVMYLVVRGGGSPLFASWVRPLPVRSELGVLDSVMNQFTALPSLLFGGTLFVPLVTGIGAYARWKELSSGVRPTSWSVQDRNAFAQQRLLDQVRSIERSSWTSGRLGDYPKGYGPSPWVQAHCALVGHDQRSARVALARLADDTDRGWLLDRPNRPEIAALMEYVPPEAAESLAVLEARVHHGTAEDLVELATQRFIDERSAEPLYLGAAGLAVRGLGDEAMQWLERAVTKAPDPRRLATAAEFSSLHARSDFQQLLGRAERAAASPPP